MPEITLPNTDPFFSVKRLGRHIDNGRNTQNGAYVMVFGV